MTAEPTRARALYIGSEWVAPASGDSEPVINPATGQKPPAAEDPKPDQYKTRAALVAFVKKAFADGAALIQSKGDKGLDDLITDPFSHRQVRVGDMAWGLLEHSGEHYGQLVVYYRVAGLVPPESRPHK